MTQLSSTRCKAVYPSAAQEKMVHGYEAFKHQVVGGQAEMHVEATKALTGEKEEGKSGKSGKVGGS